MKKLLIVGALILGMTSCQNGRHESFDENGYGYEYVTIDGCEYIQKWTAHRGFMAKVDCDCKPNR